jgi:hypothetical protein
MRRSFESCLLVLLLTFGCSKDGSSGGSSQVLNTTTKCEIEASDSSLKTCFEYTNLPEANFSIASSSCAEVSGTFTAKAACSRTDNVGGCTQGGDSVQGSNIKLVLYYYSPGMTVDQTKQTCGAQNSQYVAP